MSTVYSSKEAATIELANECTKRYERIVSLSRKSLLGRFSDSELSVLAFVSAAYGPFPAATLDSDLLRGVEKLSQDEIQDVDLFRLHRKIASLHYHEVCGLMDLVTVPLYCEDSQ